MFRAARRIHDELQEFMDKGEYLRLNIHTITSRGTEYHAMTARILPHLEALEDERDEEKIAADEDFRKKLSRLNDSSLTLSHDLVVLKMVSRFLLDLDKELTTLEECKAAEPDKDYSACYITADKTVNQIQQTLRDSSIELDHSVYRDIHMLAKRLLTLKTQDKTEPKPAFITASLTKDFDTPKVNIPKFKGGMAAWHCFWGRFRPAVHDNIKIKNAVKMAILLDLVDDPSTASYLQAQNDGKEDRYQASIKYLQSRFDKPRQLHQLYCQQLQDLPPIKGTSEELSRTVDSIFAAVEGIRRGGQTDIDYIATSMVVSVLPEQLRLQWETKTEANPKVPNIDTLIEFMRTKATNACLSQKQVVHPSSLPQKEKKKPLTKTQGKVYVNQSEPAAAGGNEDHRPNKQNTKQYRASNSGNHSHCSLCTNNHPIFQCRQFSDLSVQQRREHIQSASLCFNCLRSGHSARDCTSTFRCRVCKKAHNTLLHTEAPSTPVTVNHVVHHTQEKSETTALPQQKERLLMTSQVLLTNSVGEKVAARAMLDSGAAISVLSNRMMAQLQLQKTEDWMTVSGIESQKHSPARPTTNLTITSLSNPDWTTSVRAVILPKVTVDLPKHDLSAVKKMPHLQDLQLADPWFHKPKRVDLILDSDVFDQILLPNKIEGPPATPSAWETRLGWGIMGRYLLSQLQSSATSAVNINTAEPVETDRLDNTLEGFWKREELLQGTLALSTQEMAVQKHFLTTHYFSPSAGRYVVSLPRRTTSQKLGDSHHTARTRFLRNEQSLLKKEKWTQFQTVVQEYLTLGHAQKVTPMELCTPTDQTYTLPMHAVYKTSSSSTKLRVVFDGSCPTSTGISLNDVLATGPTLHPNLDQILIRFRKHKVAVSADIGKMYREVLLSQPDRQLHRFLWRAQPDQPLETYCMNRVTFGVRSSPYLAVRALQQTAEDFSSPDTVRHYHVHNSIYVDDLLAGAEDTASAVELYKDLRALLLEGGFDLKKWRSSSEEVLKAIPTALTEVMPQQEMIDHHASAYPKTLGIAWDSRRDVMAAQVQLPEEYVSTKRGIISDTAKSFDVLGWLAPFIIRMKILFQELWKLKDKIGWDDPLENYLADQHKEWREQLSVLKCLTLPRCYFTPGAVVSVQLHGFSDASEAACAAAVYLRATYDNGTTSCRLVVAKTRVTPIKTVTMPRLELCAAEMVADLLFTTQQTLQIPDVELWGWSDSTIAIAWLRQSPSKFKTYVANRVASAARSLSQEAWLHVPTAENPADCASRGISAQDLKDHLLWWNGPPWLQIDPIAIPDQPDDAEYKKHQELEAKPAVVHIIQAVADTGWQSKFKSYVKLSHVTAYLFRYYRNLKAAVNKEPPDRNPVLSPAEVTAAETVLFRQAQARAFPRELQRLSAAVPEPMRRDSPLKLVHPFLDKEGLLRVGGRLNRSSLPYLQKHPIILSANDYLTKLLFQYNHVHLSHCGPTLLMAHVGQQVYVPGAKRLSRSVCQNCLLCRRVAPRCFQQRMGQLPPPRVEKTLAFTHTGVDYAGPFYLKTGHPRRPIPVKAYLAVFVCLASKAVHLEIVSAKTTEAFTATFKRFIARRNAPQHLYSDNGSNFVGARNEMRELFKFLSISQTQVALKEALLSNRIECHFIPDRAPHFGGIWEAAVKTAKHCLKRTVGKTMLTFEELTTVCCQAEACINSRPYTSQDSQDPAGEMPLTPSHFLTGRPMGAYPELPEDPDLTLTNRWSLCKAMVQRFWELWQLQYLQALQKSQKWHKTTPNFKPGDLVMVLEETSLQTTWKMGKVVSVSPGADGLVRAATVTVKTAERPGYPRNKPLDPKDISISTSTLKRPITKLSPLMTASPLLP